MGVFRNKYSPWHPQLYLSREQTCPLKLILTDFQSDHFKNLVPIGIESILQLVMAWCISARAPLVRQLSPENRPISYTFGHSLIFCMVVDIGQTKNSSRENPKFSAAILDFGRHLEFWHSRMKICLRWEVLSLKYHVIPLFIGFRWRQI